MKSGSDWVNSLPEVSCCTYVRCAHGKTDDVFIPLSDWVDDAGPYRREHIEGYISLRVDDQELLGPDTWDDVDYFWMYAAERVKAFCDGNDSEIWFPDQPLVIKIERVNKELTRIAVNSDPIRSGVCREQAFISALAMEAVRACDLFAKSRVNLGADIRAVYAGVLARYGVHVPDGERA